VLVDLLTLDTVLGGVFVVDLHLCELLVIVDTHDLSSDQIAE